MTDTTRNAVQAMIRQLPPETLWQIASMCDGHGIIDPRKLIEAGLPAPVVDYYTDTLKSDGTPKGTIFVEGKPVESLQGVYGLYLLEAIADALGVEYRRCIGRGRTAQAIHAALRQHLGIDTESLTP